MLVFLDAGHGGIDPVTKKYQVLTGGKQFTHTEGTFHEGRIFYEGVFNRQLADLLEQALRERGVDVVKVYHPHTDTTLQNRVDTANTHHSLVREGVFVSIHANAHNGRARGFSIWTTKGQTNSDRLASDIFQAVDSSLGKTIQMRQDRTDGDHDYEENFFVLRNTRMPSVLIETLFFDNLQDATLLNNPQFQRRMADAIAQGITQNLKPPA
jgi:N-acetylmuramoyl-L-alanine amidase